jgi:hypothetical protein
MVAVRGESSCRETATRSGLQKIRDVLRDSIITACGLRKRATIINGVATEGLRLRSPPSTFSRNLSSMRAGLGLCAAALVLVAPDARWNDEDLSCLTSLALADFEPVNVASLIVSNDSGATSH